jgi:ABC-type amino acid transport substrate-binding protein
VLQQISYKPERDDAVDFSDSYYNVNQALVSAEGPRSPTRPRSPT